MFQCPLLNRADVLNILLGLLAIYFVDIRAFWLCGLSQIKKKWLL